MKNGLSKKQKLLKALCDEWPESISLFDLIPIGGTCAYRRMKELNDRHGIGIEFMYDYDRNGKRMNTTRYFLMPDPENVDIINLCLKN